MEQEIISILNGINPYVEISSTTKLLEDDVLDSIGIVLLITELEERYRVVIPVETVKIEDFQTVETVIKLVERLL